MFISTAKMGSRFFRYLSFPFVIFFISLFSTFYLYSFLILLQNLLLTIYKKGNLFWDPCSTKIPGWRLLAACPLGQPILDEQILRKAGSIHTLHTHSLEPIIRHYYSCKTGSPQLAITTEFKISIDK